MPPTDHGSWPCEPHRETTRHTLHACVPYRSPQSAPMHPWKTGGGGAGGWVFAFACACACPYVRACVRLCVRVCARMYGVCMSCTRACFPQITTMQENAGALLLLSIEQVKPWVRIVHRGKRSALSTYPHPLSPQHQVLFVYTLYTICTRMTDNSRPTPAPLKNRLL